MRFSARGLKEYAVRNASAEQADVEIPETFWKRLHL
jgi:hypothetical protein